VNSLKNVGDVLRLFGGFLIIYVFPTEIGTAQKLR